jgi:hypothetical protein|tara:strand:+ start:48956 stop:51052 length:2097 start_codon:yes stop_codon:yes gene_type:complete
VDFQGFQHIFPPAVLILIAAGLIFLSWAAYRKFSSIPPLSRWGLISLRASALIMILLLLLNPYFYSSQEIELKPNIAVFLDNSESIGITKGDYNGLQTYKELLNTLDFESRNIADIQFYSIGETVSEFNPDSLNASITQTNLSDPINAVLEMEEQVQAGVIISDGIITFGRNPSVNAFNSSIPLYTVAIGDTSKVRDISVSNVLTNATGYTNTNHIIEAEITQSGFANNTVTVSLVSDNETLDTQEVSFETDDQLKQVSFELELTEPGLKQYDIRIAPLADEWTQSNNNRLFTIDVLDSKVKILHVAFEIHPDIKAIRSIIQQDESNELTTLTWLGGNRFVEDLPEESDFNLVIVHGVPNTQEVFPFLEDLENTPTLFFELSTSRINRVQNQNLLELINKRNNQASQITLNQLLEADEQPILELPAINLADSPPLYSPLRTELSALQSTALFSINYDGLNTDFPAIAVLEQGNIRRSHVLPWGWYRMTQSTNPSQREFVIALISNIVSWTSSDPDNRLLRISPSKKTFSTAESAILNGSLQNERGDPEGDGIIEVELETEAGESRTFNMENSGNGNYRLDLPRLSEGLYKYDAVARKGEREIESQSGEFLISNSSSELTNTIRDDELLGAIARNSGGRFFTYQDVSTFWDSLRTANVLETQTQTIENYSFPVRSVYWFVIVLLLLGSEWLLRKYYSLP